MRLCLGYAIVDPLAGNETLQTKDEMQTLKSIETMLEASVPCKRCGSQVSELALFPGGICVKCHEVRFNQLVKFNGGILPRPDFSKSVK